MSETPQCSLPKQMEQWKDLKAAYRFLDNKRVDPVEIGRTHRSRTRDETARQPVTLLVQDDTDLQAVKIQGGRYIQHSTLAVRPDGVLLGVMQQYWFPRVSAPKNEKRTQRMQRWRESCVWSDAAREIGEAPEGCRYIHVADRASDNIAFMEACDEVGHGFVIRACHDRRVDKKSDVLWSRLAKEPACGELTVTVGVQRDDRGRIVRRRREAIVEVALATVQIEAPWNHPGDHSPRTVQAIHLRELEAPDGVEAIDWMLLTGEPAQDFSDAKVIVGYYARRWVVEEWHRAMKEGCRLEQSQLKSADNLQRLAAINSIIAVRLLQLRDLADPERSSEAADDPKALQRQCPALWIHIVAGLAHVEPGTLTPRQFFLTIAKRGGFIGRKSDGRPGWKVIWLGWYDVSQMVRGAELSQRATTRCG